MTDGVDVVQSKKDEDIEEIDHTPPVVFVLTHSDQATQNEDCGEVVVVVIPGPSWCPPSPFFLCSLFSVFFFSGTPLEKTEEKKIIFR